MSDTSDNIKIACPHCKVVLETDASVEGTRVACPECGREFVPQRHNPGAMKVAKPKLKKKRKFGIVQIVAAVLFLFQAKACSDSKSSDHQDIFLTEDGHYRSETVSGLKTFSAIAYGVGMIPGIGPVVWVPAFGIGFGANLWSNAVQKREDERWERSMQWLRDSGYDPDHPFGKYGD
jgi:hypothetical protein